VSGFANDLKFERDRARDVMEVISSDIEKNFYDSNLKGLDWKSLVADTDRKIEAAQSVSAMYTAIFGLINKLDDSHTALLPPGRAVEIKFGFNAKPFGEKVLVYELTKKGPAEIAGLQLGDELLLMNGFKVNRQSYQKIVYYLRMIRPANELEIVYRRGNGELQKLRWETQVENKPLMVDVTEFANMWKYIRESENRDQEYRPQWRKFDEVGYIKLKEFIENERDQGENLLRRLDNPKALVVDLRGNGGGAQNGLLDFSGFLEPAPVTMCEVSGRRRTEQLKIKPYSPQFPIPMVILIDSESASASEMFARHFQREKRAVVVGDTSEGAVNEALFFDHKLGADIVVFYGIEVAVGKVVFPDGEVLEKKGVTPDQMCLPTTSDLQDGKDPCLDKAVLLAHDLAKNGVDGKVTTSGK
jgi:carboxyl-terminal processing protease